MPVALSEKARAASVDPSKIKGKHPAIANVKANVPPTCLTGCHKPGSRGNSNRFLTANQGERTHCHKLNQKTGTWKAASSAEK